MQHILLSDTNSIHRKFTTNFTVHHGLGSKQIHQAAKFSVPNIIYSLKSLSSWHNFWCLCFDVTRFRTAQIHNCRFRWLRQGSCFCLPKKMRRHFWGTLGPRIFVIVFFVADKLQDLGIFFLKGKGF